MSDSEFDESDNDDDSPSEQPMPSFRDRVQRSRQPVKYTVDVDSEDDVSDDEDREVLEDDNSGSEVEARPAGHKKVVVESSEDSDASFGQDDSSDSDFSPEVRLLFVMLM